MENNNRTVKATIKSLAETQEILSLFSYLESYDEPVTLEVTTTDSVYLWLQTIHSPIQLKRGGSLDE